MAVIVRVMREMSASASAVSRTLGMATFSIQLRSWSPSTLACSLHSRYEIGGADGGTVTVHFIGCSFNAKGLAYAKPLRNGKVRDSLTGRRFELADRGRGVT